MSRPIYKIRFPIIKERTRVGRRVRVRLIADQAGLWGARACAAGMVTAALSYRDEAPSTIPEHVEIYRRVARLGMRQMALWARVFAGQIDQHDPRIDAAAAEREALVCALSAKYAA